MTEKRGISPRHDITTDSGSPTKPFGLQREPWEECTINFSDTDGMTLARDLECGGWVEIHFLRSHVQNQNSLVLQSEYWHTYQITPTQKAIDLLDEIDKEGVDG